LSGVTFSFTNYHAGNTYPAYYTYTFPVNGLSTIAYSFTGHSDVTPTITYSFSNGTTGTVGNTKPTITGNISVPSEATSVTIRCNTNRHNTAGYGLFTFN